LLARAEIAGRGVLAAAVQACPQKLRIDSGLASMDQQA